MSIGSHQRSIGKSQAHFTPRAIIDALGPFDLDPCAGWPRPWDCAEHCYTCQGLERPWHGRVWLNPPFDRREVGKWIEHLATYGRGTALLHARTETAWFRPCWNAAAILFLFHRIKFCDQLGNAQIANSGAPPVLVAWGAYDAYRLRTCGLPGKFINP